MNAILADTFPFIIGQTPHMTLAALRSPGWIPDTVTSFLFQTQWMYWIALGLGGAALVLFGRRPVLRRVGIAFFIAALVWVMLAALFVTPRERLWQAHAAILTATQTRNPQEIQHLLAPDFRFGAMDRAAMSQGIETVLSQLKIISNTVRFFAIDLAGTAADSQINILTTVEPTASGTEGPHLTKWVLRWRDTPGEDWRLVEIRRWYYGDQEMPTELPLPH